MDVQTFFFRLVGGNVCKFEENLGKYVAGYALI